MDSTTLDHLAVYQIMNKAVQPYSLYGRQQKWSKCILHVTLIVIRYYQIGQISKYFLIMN